MSARHILPTVVLLGIAISLANPVRAQTSTLTFQGQLKEDGAPANGSYSLVFKLYNAASGGTQVGPTVTKNGIVLNNGLFAQTLDFGSSSFDGSPRWVQLTANGTALVPRHEITASPYAIKTRGISADDAGNIGIGSSTPHHRLRLSGGPSWTANGWAGSLELDNAAAIGWQSNAAGSRFGIGQTVGGLYFFHTASDPGTTGTSAVYDMTIADSGKIGIGTITPAFPLTIQKTGLGWAHTDGVRTLVSNVDSLGGWLGTHSGHSLHFFTGGSPPLATLTTSGNFGIGTITPTRALHVRDTDLFTARFESSNTTAAAVEFQNSSSNATWEYAVAGSGLPFGLPAGSMYFYKQGEGFPNLSLHTNGIVGIGTNAPNTATRLNVLTGGAGHQAVRADAPNGNGVVGTSAATGYGATAGINSANGGVGVYGEAHAQSGRGVWGTSNQGVGVSAQGGYRALEAYGFNGGLAAFLSGDVFVIGNVEKNGGDFRIDHPLDPANKYLRHSFVESPDMMNVYNGNVTTDEEGYATIVLPDWFEALNKDFRYQLTAIDTDDSVDFVHAKVVREVEGNQFTIRSSRPAARISWQVTGIRQDAWANAHRIVVEEEKPERERGKYLTPELYGHPREMGIGYRPSSKALDAATDAASSGE